MNNRIKELRKAHRMTQVRLSIELNVSQETISSYENQKHYPSFTQLVRLSELFGASIDYIMGLSDKNETADIANTAAAKMLLHLCDKLNKKQFELVIAYAQGVFDDSQI